MKNSHICFTGDLVLDLPDADYWLSGISKVLSEAELSIGHIEVPHTNADSSLEGDVPAPGAPLENISAIRDAGFNCVTLAGNHIADCGIKGIQDTIAALDEHSLAHTGAGVNLPQARSPAYQAFGTRKIGILSYNCIGPQIAWASEDRCGCAYLPVELQRSEDVTPNSDFGKVAPEAREILQRDIQDLRENGADIVIVALHKGRVHTPVIVQTYERELAHMSVDSGADLVISHHAHILRGFEFYKSKPIFHGLGNGCVVTTALSPGQDNAAREAWVERRKKMFGFEPDPDYTFAPFHPEAVNAMIGVAKHDNAEGLKIGFYPVFVEPPGRPVLAEGETRQKVIDYIATLTPGAGLGRVDFEDTGSVVWVTPA